MAGITKADLEKEITKLNNELNNYRKWLLESEERYDKLVNERETQLEQLPTYKQMQKRIKELEDIKKSNETTIEHKKKTEKSLRDKIQGLLEENKQLKESIKNQTVINDTKHNARGAGRKPKSEETIQKQLQQLDLMIKDGQKEKEICEDMGISRATYYRLKKILKN